MQLSRSGFEDNASTFRSSTFSASSAEQLDRTPTRYSPIRYRAGVVFFVQVTASASSCPRRTHAHLGRRPEIQAGTVVAPVHSKPWPVVPTTSAEVALWLGGGAGEITRVAEGATG